MILSLVGAKYHFAHSKVGEMHWLCAGVLIGGFLQMAVPAAVLFKLGWKPRFDLALSPRVREIAMLMTPGSSAWRSTRSTFRSPGFWRSISTIRRSPTCSRPTA